MAATKRKFGDMAVLQQVRVQRMSTEAFTGTQQVLRMQNKAKRLVPRA